MSHSSNTFPSPVSPTITLPAILVRTAVAHTITYVVMGVLAAFTLDYARAFADPTVRLLMRQTSDPLVMAGPLFQPIRGVLFGIVLYLLREAFFNRRRGYLVLWVTLMIVGVAGTFGPAPGSLEGMIYTILPIGFQLRGLPEVLLQTFFLSWLVCYWVRHPEKRWLNWTLGIACFLALLGPVLGLLVGRPGTH
ncbi:MAG: hypothetical protein ABSH47_11475 [Bryobacteraceae bacterium]|jgi:hypothetical protein